MLRCGKAKACARSPSKLPDASGGDVAFAGTEGVVKPIEALSVEEFEDTMRTNVTGVWPAMKHCVGSLTIHRLDGGYVAA
jgi:hypothetical protein